VPDEGAEQLQKAKKLTSEDTKEKKRKGNTAPSCLQCRLLTAYTAVDDSTTITAKKSKKSKILDPDGVAPASTKAKKSKIKADTESKNVRETESHGDLSSDIEEEKPGNSDDENSEVDDQTVALLKGFESDGDEDDAAKEGGLAEGRKVPKVPTMTNRNKKVMKRAAEIDGPEKPGVVYVGHIPHGFYEHEMRQYFEQFGSILQLRLSRNRKTGASKHYAFIQFASNIVADIVAKTMDNYLLFNHILKVKLISDEQVPENLFKGANKRFKKVPWNKIAGRKLAQGASEATWEKRIEKEENRRAEKAEKMKALGYEFEAPKIKSAKNVSKKAIEQPSEQAATIENVEEEIQVIEAVPLVEEQSKPKEKKEKKKKTPKTTPGYVTEPVTDVSEKTLKRTKSKADLASAGEEIAEETTKKQKKSRKAKSEG
jgi:nucleolar protein 15